MILVDQEPRLHVAAFGAGPPVILLSGWSATWQVWEPTMTELSRWAQCLAPDTRGVGGSDQGDGAATLGDLVHDVFRVMDAHRIEKCVLAGESLGGLVALHAAARHPARFSGLCIIGTPRKLDDRTASALTEGCLADYESTVTTFVGASVTEPEAQHLTTWAEEIYHSTRPVTAVQLLQAVTSAPPPDRPRLQVPTVVVHGTADVVVPLEAAHELVAMMPGSKLSLLDGVGHKPTLTRPREVAAAIRSLL